MKAILATLALLAVSLPLMANSAASMSKQSAPVRMPTITMSPSVATQPVTTQPSTRRYYVYFRYDAHHPWYLLGWTYSLSEAQYYAAYYRYFGETFVR